VAVAYEDAGSIKDSRIRFLGTPAGYEFISLVQAILLVGGGESILSPDNRARMAAVAQPVRIQVFTTPS
jgi:alkyl hydroperoxide reductase subunit AhpF